jgi:hypothetical protein
MPYLPLPVAVTQRIFGRPVEFIAVLVFDAKRLQRLHDN